MRIVILQDGVGPSSRPDELDVLAQVEAVVKALHALEHEAIPMPFSLDLAGARSSLRRHQPDLVFNLVEAVEGSGRLIYLAPALLDAMNIPYTGAGTEAMFITSNKIVAKQILSAHGIATPAWFSTEDLARLGEREAAARAWPARRGGDEPFIIKSLWEEASVGLEDDSIVPARDLSTLREELERRLGRLGGEAFAEAFIDGREFNLSVLGDESGNPEVLPPAEIRFIGYAPGKPRFVGYRAKWDETSFEYHHTPRRFDFPDGDRGLLDELKAIAARCWRLLGLHGYVRVDFRVDHAGKPWLLEVNANPCLSPDSGFVATTQQAGMSYEKVIERILRDIGGLSNARHSPLYEGGATGGHGFTGDSPGSHIEGVGDSCLPAARESMLPQSEFRTTVRPADAEAVREIVTSTGFFTEAEIAVAVELVDERMAKGEASGYYFVFTELNGQVIGYACYGPIACTVGSFDLFWIAVHADYRGQGIGRRLVRAAEPLITAAGGRRIYIETSSRPLYAPTRAFYEKCGYTVEAVLKDFYAPGDDKVVYVREL